jgi:hypothetical protein
MILKQLLDLREDDHDIEDDDDDASLKVYAREKEVSIQILRAFRKCGIPVAEHESSKHSGIRDHGDSWGFDVLYEDSDREATVKAEEATMSSIVKLSQSGLVDGDVTITPTSDGDFLRLVFKVDENVATGKAKMEK